MNAIITITEVITGKYPAIKADKDKYAVKDASLFKVGDYIVVEYKEEWVTNPNTQKKFKAKELISFTKSQTNGAKDVLGSKYSANEIKAFEEKGKAIGRGCALNNACIVVSAYATAWASTNSIKDKTELNLSDMLHKMKHDEYLDNLKLLKIEPTEEEYIDF